MWWFGSQGTMTTSIIIIIIIVSLLCFVSPPFSHQFLSWNTQHIDPVIISQKVIQGVYPGVTTVQLDE
jgi:hypothetical protein